MASDNKIADELFSLFNQYRYSRYCQYLSDCDSVSLQYFKSTEMGSPLWTDTRWCFINDQLNPNHLLEIFGRFSDKDLAILRQRVLDMVEQESNMWESIGRVVLSMKFLNLNNWIKSMRDA